MPTLSVAKCTPYIFEVRRWHTKYFGLNFPYWYSVAQIEVESNCTNIISKDGVGSEGLPQITYRWWKDELSKYGIMDLKTISNQLHAQAVINKYHYKKLPIKKLYIMYQVYNRSFQTVVNENKEGIYELGKFRCEQFNLKNICVYKLPNGTCKQYRTNCDINYSYGKKIYTIGQKYKYSKDIVPYF